MKDIKTIALELKDKILPNKKVYTQENTEAWVYYISLSGYYNDVYFNIDLMHHVGGLTAIKSAHTTEDHQMFIDMIKEIEPEAKIQYTEVEKIYHEKTI